MNKLLSFLNITLILLITTQAIAGAVDKIEINENNNNGYVEVKDCFEKVNRGIFGFNQILDLSLIHI